MQGYVFLIIILLIMSVVNNLLMYHKCYHTKSLSSSDHNLHSDVDVMTINVYYKKENDTTKCYNHSTVGTPVIDNLKSMLSQYETNNSNKCVILYSNPTHAEYIKINKLSGLN